MEAFSTIAIILGLTEVVKKLGLPKKFLPLFAIVLGAGVSILILGVTTYAIIAGIVAGLTAQGMYTSVKTTAGK